MSLYTLTSLPVELLDLVCGYCDIPTLKSLRLSCSSLCPVPEKRLYQEVLFFMHRKSLRSLENIANNPRLARHVESLWMHGDHPVALDFKSFQQKWHEQCVGERASMVHDSVEMHQRREELAKAFHILSKKEFSAQRRRNYAAYKKKVESIPLPELSLEDLQGYHKTYERLSQEGISLESDWSLQQALTLFFQKCPNLTSIEISLGREGTFSVRERRTRYSRSEFNKEFKDGLVIAMAQPEDFDCGIHIMKRVVLALVDSKIALRTIKINSVASSLATLQSFKTTIPVVARNLRYLDWDLPQKWQESYGSLKDLGVAFNGGHLLAFIKHSPQLQTLSLTFPYAILQDLDYLPQLCNLVGDTTWDMLTTFRISGLKATASDMTSFLLRHASSLREVFLENAALEIGTWPECFEGIAGRLPKLLIFKLLGTLADRKQNGWRWFGNPSHDDYPSILSKYLITGGDSFPHPPRDDGNSRSCINPVWADS